MSVLLKNLIWHNGSERLSGDVRVSGIILEIAPSLAPKKSEQVIEFNNHFLYPGLINAHDHLEMNLYPRLGTPPYKNYVEWGRDIYKPDQSPIREIESVNIKDRLLWGGLKNLISGATTVVHHNPWHSVLRKATFPVNVLKEMTWAHSLQFGKNIAQAFPRKHSTPFVIHAGEGTDDLAFSEISTLDAMGLLKKNTVLIHAVGTDDNSIEKIRIREASVVWCPASNFFLFGETAPVEKMRGKIKIAIGSDSTLTGSACLLDEMRCAIDSTTRSPREIFEMVTQQPARIFDLHEPEIAQHNIADLFVTPIRHEDYFENLMVVQPADIALVLVKGKVSLLDSEIESTGSSLKNSINLAGRRKLTDLDVGTLKKSISKQAGNEILEKNPLWMLIQV